MSLSLDAGEILALVGETRSGKSTIGRVLAGLQHPDSGSVRLGGRDLYSAGPSRPERARLVQMNLQDPRASLNPRWKIGKAVVRLLVVNRLLRAETQADAVQRLLAEV